MKKVLFEKRRGRGVHHDQPPRAPERLRLRDLRLAQRRLASRGRRRRGSRRPLHRCRRTRVLRRERRQVRLHRQRGWPPRRGPPGRRQRRLSGAGGGPQADHLCNQRSRETAADSSKRWRATSAWRPSTRSLAWARFGSAGSPAGAVLSGSPASCRSGAHSSCSTPAIASTRPRPCGSGWWTT